MGNVTRRALRKAAAVGAIGLLTTGVSVLPGNARAAGATQSASEAPPGLSAFDGSDMATLPANLRYTLSPQLAGMLGTSTLDAARAQRLRAAARPGLPGERTPPVGTTLLWPALDTVEGGPVGIYLKQYTLRAVGKKIEVWVASGRDGVSTGTEFPSGDCRNAVPHSTEITDAQVENLVEQFDRNMYPKETETFSTPLDRAGTNALPGIVAAGLDFAGDGDHTVTLVDNVRDDNFYEFPKNKSYAAGFYAPIFNQLTDRNVMTIDAFDWLHRTGAHPANEPNVDLCKSRPARPFAYEGVFAHEWQHLLHQYQDPDETTWVNEGLSDFAISLTGYGDARRTVHQVGAQSHIFCFQGFGTVQGPANPNPNRCGGPENSLTSWGDEGAGSEILADYGNTWSFMLFLYDRYGAKFLSALHRDGKAQGLAGVQDQLDTFAKGTRASDVLHDFQLMNLVDHYVDVKGGSVDGIEKARIVTRSLDATVSLKNPSAFSLPGAAPNGADYVLLKQDGKALRSLRFVGSGTVMAPGSDPQDLAIPFLGGSAADGAGVDNWFVSLVGIDKARHRVLVRSFDKAFAASAGAGALSPFAAYPMVVAVVSHDNTDDLDTAAESYARYTLEVNGVEQPGG